MTDHNANEIDLAGQKESAPDGPNPRPAILTEGDAPAGNEVASADCPETNQAVAVAGELPGSNPFAEMVGEVPLEAELRELAARNSEVQITDTYQIHTDTPAGCSLAAPMGFQASQDPLACIEMSVRVTRTIEVTGVPTGETTATGEVDTPTQTVVTQREAQGVIINVLNNVPENNLLGLSGVGETDELYRINTDFAAGLLNDGGDETFVQLMETYHPAADFPLDVPTLELDFNQFELDENGSGPETKSGPEEESEESAIVTAAPGMATPSDQARARATTAGVETSSRWMEEDGTEISNVGLFRRESGQPVWLRAYPYVRPEPVPLSCKRPQAYRGQDHYNPVWTYVRHTRRDRLRAFVKHWKDVGSPMEDDRPTSEFEIRLYKGERDGSCWSPSPGSGRLAPQRNITGLKNVTGWL